MVEIIFLKLLNIKLWKGNEIMYIYKVFFFFLVRWNRNI